MVLYRVTKNWRPCLALGFVELGGISEDGVRKSPPLLFEACGGRRFLARRTRSRKSRPDLKRGACKRGDCERPSCDFGPPGYSYPSIAATLSQASPARRRGFGREGVFDGDSRAAGRNVCPS